MTVERDRLTKLLDESVPELTRIEAGADASAMLAEARTVSRPAPSRRSRLVIGVAMASIVTLAGGGAALATGLISWPDELTRPDLAMEFTLTNGRACEFRIVVEESGGDPGPDKDLEDKALAAFSDWLTSLKVEDLDIAAAKRQIAQWDATEPEHTVALNKDGHLVDIMTPAAQRSAETSEAWAYDVAITDALMAWRAQSGHEYAALPSTSGLQCEVVE